MPRPFRLPLLCAALALHLATAPCVAGAREPEPSPERLAAAGIHHAPRTEHGFENNDGPLVRGSFWKWRWNRLIHGLPPPPANGYAFPVDHPDVEWIKANRSENTMTWIGHASTLLQIGGELEEAARVAGAGELRVRRDVTLPLARSGMLAAWLLGFLIFVRE
jgi:hypothetical protein